MWGIKILSNKTKIIVVTGGVISGLGKGVIVGSLGYLLKEQGYKVDSIKIDPYLNVDAGTMRPTEHGEVFVTKDGGETDQDIGTYERYLNKEFTKGHNITTGQVYLSVIQRERNLEYDGKCVEIIPHIPDEVVIRIQNVIKKSKPDFLLVEIGGTAGDYQNILFLDAMRQLKLKRNHLIFVHVVYLPVPNNISEMKTKPAQHSVRMLNQISIHPDMIISRSHFPLDSVRREKLSVFCNVKETNIFDSPDVHNIYEVPLVLEKQGMTEKIFSMFKIKKKKKKLKKLKEKVERIKKIKKDVKVAIIGKYFDIGDFSLSDSYISVIEALKHASWENNVNPVIEWIDSKDYEKDPSKVRKLKEYDGIIIPGGFGKKGVEGKIKAIRYARENNIPYLGLCYGMQLAVIEFSRNVCGMKNANSTEINKSTQWPVIDILPEQIEKLKNKDYGNTMRLGNYTAVLKKGSVVHNIYKKDKVIERHRHRYEVNPEFIKKIEDKGLVFSGRSTDGTLMEFAELPDNNFFVGTQAHPEFKSTFENPAPLYMGFVKAAKRKSSKKIKNK